LSVHGLDVGELVALLLLSLAFGALGIALWVVPWLIPSWLGALLVFLFCGAPWGLVFLLSALLFFLRSLSAIGLRVSVYPDGLARSRFGRMVYFRWNQVRTVRTNHPSNLSIDMPGRGILFFLVFLIARLFLFISYSIHLEDDRTFHIAGLRGLDRLGQTIERESCRSLLPGAVQRFQAGETLDFGVLRVSREGITKGLHTQPWGDVTSIFFDRDGYFTIGWKDQPWTNCIVVSPAKVLNLAVLLALMSEVKRLTGATWEGNLV
jgi:hypothetical protein